MYPADITSYLEKADAQDKKLHIFTDTSKFGKLSVEGRRVLTNANKDSRQGKVAAIGVNRWPASSWQQVGKTIFAFLMR
ncbi:MAG: hypothetical protein ACI9EW_001288 [Cellvibrionaceae bacterium]